MALADGADLIVLAPGVKQFGEDPTIDRMIRRFGYHGTPATLEKVKNNPDLAAELSTAAHLIHSSSEGRFNITYCPGGLSREETEGVGFRYADLASTIARYNPAKMHDGFNTVDGEEVFFISHPALGLWASGISGIRETDTAAVRFRRPRAGNRKCRLRRSRFAALGPAGAKFRIEQRSCPLNEVFRKGTNGIPCFP